MAQADGGPAAEPVTLRDVAERDLEAVLRLNEGAVPAVNSLSLMKLSMLQGEAAYFRLAECSSQLAGFLLCFAPGAAYGSPNFRWLSERYQDFLYIDRVAVEPSFQGRGIARALYLDAAETCGARLSAIACEVNLRPRNDASLAFHDRLGFRPVGTQDFGSVQVQYLLRALPF